MTAISSYSAEFMISDSLSLILFLFSSSILCVSHAASRRDSNFHNDSKDFLRFVWKLTSVWTLSHTKFDYRCPVGYQCIFLSPIIEEMSKIFGCFRFKLYQIHSAAHARLVHLIRRPTDIDKTKTARMNTHTRTPTHSLSQIRRFSPDSSEWHHVHFVSDLKTHYRGCRRNFGCNNNSWFQF